MTAVAHPETGDRMRAVFCARADAHRGSLREMARLAGLAGRRKPDFTGPPLSG